MRQGRVNHFNNGIQFVQHLIVPESQHSITFGPKKAATPFILCLPQRMLSAVNLNHQPLLQADEIDDVTANRLLPAEFVIFKLPVTKLAP